MELNQQNNQSTHASTLIFTGKHAMYWLLNFEGKLRHRSVPMTNYQITLNVLATFLYVATLSSILKLKF